jgi:hypothetical protein
MPRNRSADPGLLGTWCRFRGLDYVAAAVDEQRTRAAPGEVLADFEKREDREVIGAAHIGVTRLGPRSRKLIHGAFAGR